MKKVVIGLMIFSCLGLKTMAVEVYPEEGKKYLLKSIPSELLDDRGIRNHFIELTSRPGGIEGSSLAVEYFEETNVKVYIFTYSTFDMPSRPHSGRRATHFTVSYPLRGGHPKISAIKEGRFEDQQ